MNLTANYLTGSEIQYETLCTDSIKWMNGFSQMTHVISENVLLRDFHAGDLEQLWSLVSRTIDACYPPFYTPLVIDFFKKYHRRENILRDADRGWTVVLEDMGKIVATGTLVGTNIRRVFVDTGCQRRGFGKGIMREIEGKAVDAGLKYVDLDASLFAKNFYLDLRYVILKHGEYPLTKEDILGYYKMAKSFSSSNESDWDLNGKRFRYLPDRCGGVEGSEGIVFEFVQRGDLVYAGYHGEKSRFGEIVGSLSGDLIEISYMQEHLDGTTDHGRSTATIRRNPDGKIRFIERCDRKEIDIMVEV